MDVLTLLQAQALDFVVQAAAFLRDLRFDHMYVLLLFPALMILLALYLFHDGLNRRKIVFFVTRLAILLCLLIALSSPYLLRSKEVMRDIPPITVLMDSSSSMGVYSQDTLASGERLYNDLMNIVGNVTGNPSGVYLDYFSREGNSTAIGDALYGVLMRGQSKENSLIILISDGNSNSGKDPVEVSKLLSESNITVHAVKPSESAKSDVYIEGVEGLKKIPVNAEYEMLVKVGKTGIGPAEYRLDISVDNSIIYSKVLVQTSELKTVSFTTSFPTVGVHELKYRITPSTQTELYDFNNVYYKTVDVVKKPRVLVISNKSSSPLVTVLSEVYDVDVTQYLLTDYSRYSAVYLNDVDARMIDASSVKYLRNYLMDGNGLVAVGGKNSFEYGSYKNSYLEGLLPVTSQEKSRDRKPIGIVFLVDVSASMWEEPGGQWGDEREKAIVVSLLQQMDSDDSVGVIAFNVNPYTVVPFKRVAAVTSDDVEQILRLQASKTFGGTDIYTTLVASHDMLRDYVNQKIVLLLTDGAILASSPRSLVLSQKQAMENDGIQIVTVGISGPQSVLGHNPEKPSHLIEPLLTDLATNGQYYQPLEHSRLNLLFNDEEDESAQAGNPLRISNRYHFITKQLDYFDVKTLDYNKVTEKSVAQVLVTVGADQPILTVWNFGLGRVVALTVDDGSLWASQLYSDVNNKLVSATTNWVIGDLEKKNPVRIESSDVSYGERAYLKVVSMDDTPSLLVKHMVSGELVDVTIGRVGVNTYTTSFMPSEPGFYGLKAVSSTGDDVDAVAVNYPAEYSKLSVDEDTLLRITQYANGGLYSVEDLPHLEESILQYVRRKSVEDVMERQPLGLVFAYMALLLFFMDVVVRRAREIIKFV